MNLRLDELSPADREFIRKNLKADPASLALKYGSDPGKKQLINQIKARQKIRKKLPEWFDNEELILPTGLALEQSSSEETAKLKASLISGKKLLDITGGLGVDTYYLSQSFQSTSYLEQNPKLVRLARHNFKKLGTTIQVEEGDGTETLKNSDADYIYADPHRRSEANQKLVSLKDYQPDVTGLLEELISNGRQSLIKTSPMLDIKAALSELKFVKEVWVISLRNECKELLFLLAEDRSPSPLYRTFNLLTEVLQHFESRPEKPTKSFLSQPQQYIYEPNASILKANLQDAVGQKFNLSKLHPQSNFYTSGNLARDFPGRIFELMKINKAWDKSLKNGRYNVISRNFPEKASLIEKKLKIKPSDRSYLLATRLKDGDYKFLATNLISPISA